MMAEEEAQKQKKESSFTSDFSRLVTKMTSSLLTELISSSGVSTASQQKQISATSSGVDLCIPKEKVLKLALVGGARVGKTTIVRRWLNKRYRASYHQTLGYEVSYLPPFRYEEEEQSVLYHIQVWDVSSAEVQDDGTLLSLLSDGLAGLFCVFNVHRISSIEAIDKWRHALAKYISPHTVPFILLSHKADLIQNRVMTSNDIDSYTKAAGFKCWLWTVGRHGLGDSEQNPGVVSALNKMIKHIRQRKDYLQLMGEAVNQKKSSMVLSHNRFNDSAIEIITTDTIVDKVSAPIFQRPTQEITSTPRSKKNFVSRKKTHSKSVDIIEKVKSSANLLNNDADQTKKDCEKQQSSNKYLKEWIFGRYLYVQNQSSYTSKEVINVAETKQEDKGWLYYAGSIDREKAAEILENEKLGSFLVRRKDPVTLVLSYKTDQKICHVLINYKQKLYSIGTTKKATQTISYSSLSECLHSVSDRAVYGLVITKSSNHLSSTILERQSSSVSSNSSSIFSFQTKTFMKNINKSLEGEEPAKEFVPSAWRVYAAIGSATNGSEEYIESLQSDQSNIRTPGRTRIFEISRSFYNKLERRMKQLIEKLSSQNSKKHEIRLHQLNELLDQILVEKQCVLEDKLCQDHITVVQLEGVWRKVVDDIFIWKKIILNLEAEVYVDSNQD